MCGIAGLFHLETPKPVDPARIRAMADAQSHRGPDGSGVWTAPGVGLGHRRLSIIDLAGSPQPMTTADGAVTISFNGEIYNYTQIRADLKSLGHEFKTAGNGAWAFCRASTACLPLRSTTRATGRYS
jgi:asparagine synthase (glutamine-hydrolysing)